MRKPMTVRSKLLAVLVGLCVPAALTACKDVPSKADCEQLLEHILTIEVDSTGRATDDAMKAALAEEKERIKDFVKQSFLTTCENDVPKRYVTCALAAKTRSDIAACSVPSDS